MYEWVFPPARVDACTAFTHLLNHVLITSIFHELPMGPEHGEEKFATSQAFEQMRQTLSEEDSPFEIFE